VAAKTFRAKHKYARITARKARPVMDLVRGRGVNEALNTLQFVHRRAAPMISKVIRSALANAGQDLDVDVNRLVIADARVDEGPLLGGRARWRPRAMGRVYPILKRTSHLSVILEELEEQARETTRRQPRRKKAEPEADRGPETPEASEEAPEPEPEAEAKAAGSEEPNTEAEPTTEAGEPEAGAAGSAEPEPEAGEPEAGAAGSAEPTTEAGEPEAGAAGSAEPEPEAEEPKASSAGDEPDESEEKKE
jgi:large subunit ribosomal protein L22